MGVQMPPGIYGPMQWLVLQLFQRLPRGLMVLLLLACGSEELLQEQLMEARRKLIPW
jgi:hypothetical protein